MNEFWGINLTSKNFIPFNNTHIIGVLLILFTISFLKMNSQKIKKSKNKNKIEITIASILFIQQFLLYLWYITSGSFTLAESLPLYSCRLAIIGSIYMIIKKDFKFFEIIYFWGITGCIIALITPDTSYYNFPHFMCIQYFVGHGTLLFAIYYMILIYDFKPTLSSLLNTYKVTIIYIFIVFFINKNVNGNYAYLNNKPETATILDILPKYPNYVPIIILAMFFFFLLAYLPFYKKKDIKKLIIKKG